ncbi:MAG: hypothetical protein AVO33_07255 [delta proteobacterium ML8_F1]|nr:MAG: hypothetical protein AVO33_07255 [delta proteobacterium ML8_F1]
MTVRFFYDFREDLIKDLTGHFSKEIEAYRHSQDQLRQIDEAQALIQKYFDQFLSQMSELMQATRDQVSFDQGEEVIAKLAIMNHYLKFTRKNLSIEVKIGYHVPELNLVESQVLSYIVPGDKRAKIKRVGKVHDGSHFDENALNYYMREAFSKIEFSRG